MRSLQASWYGVGNSILMRVYLNCVCLSVNCSLVILLRSFALYFQR